MTAFELNNLIAIASGCAVRLQFPPLTHPSVEFANCIEFESVK